MVSLIHIAREMAQIILNKSLASEFGCSTETHDRAIGFTSHATNLAVAVLFHQLQPLAGLTTVFYPVFKTYNISHVRGYGADTISLDISCTLWVFSYLLHHRIREHRILIDIGAIALLAQHKSKMLHLTALGAVYQVSYRHAYRHHRSKLIELDSLVKELSSATLLLLLKQPYFSGSAFRTYLMISIVHSAHSGVLHLS